MSGSSQMPPNGSSLMPASPAPGFGGTPQRDSRENKNMACQATTSDGNQATASVVLATPVGNGYVMVTVNGVEVTVGDGVKTSDCFFSGDSGTTARAIADIAENDTCHWVGSVAGYQLQTSDRMSWHYMV